MCGHCPASSFEAIAKVGIKTVKNVTAGAERHSDQAQRCVAQSSPPSTASLASPTLTRSHQHRHMGACALVGKLKRCLTTPENRGPYRTKLNTIGAPLLMTRTRCITGNRRVGQLHMIPAESRKRETRCASASVDPVCIRHEQQKQVSQDRYWCDRDHGISLFRWRANST